MVNLNDTFAIQLIMASKRKVEALPAPLQRIVRDEGKAVIPYYRKQYALEGNNEVAFLKKNDIVFSEVQFAAFRKAVEPVYAGFRARLGGDLLDQVVRAASSS